MQLTLGFVAGGIAGDAQLPQFPRKWFAVFVPPVENGNVRGLVRGGGGGRGRRGGRGGGRRQELLYFGDHPMDFDGLTAAFDHLEKENRTKARNVSVLDNVGCTFVCILLTSIGAPGVVLRKGTGWRLRWAVLCLIRAEQTCTMFRVLRINRVHWCSLVFIGVHWCSLVFIGVH
jgi:hypothetical protein